MKLQLKAHGLQDVFPFGRWKGHTLQTVLDEDPDYLLWVHERVKTFLIDPVVMEMAYETVNSMQQNEHDHFPWWLEYDD